MLSFAPDPNNYPIYDTQTVPPTDVQVAPARTSATLTWTPIAYTGDGGYYEVSYATTPCGPFTVHGHTADKTASSYTVTGLTPSFVYYFRVRTFTPAHTYYENDGYFHFANDFVQQSDLWSDYSAVVSTDDPTPTPTATSTATETLTVTVTPPPTTTATPSATATASPTGTSTPTITSTPTATPSVTVTPHQRWLPLIWR